MDKKMRYFKLNSEASKLLNRVVSKLFINSEALNLLNFKLKPSKT